MFQSPKNQNSHIIVKKRKWLLVADGKDSGKPITGSLVRTYALTVSVFLAFRFTDCALRCSKTNPE